MADDTAQTTTEPNPQEEPKPAPPWGSDEDFNPDKAWTLIQNLRSEAASMKAASKELREKVDTLTADLKTATSQRDEALAASTQAAELLARETAGRTKDRLLTAAGLDASTYAPMLTGQDEEEWDEQVKNLVALRDERRTRLKPDPAQSATTPAVDDRTAQAHAIFGY